MKKEGNRRKEKGRERGMEGERERGREEGEIERETFSELFYLFLPIQNLVSLVWKLNAAYGAQREGENSRFPFFISFVGTLAWNI